MSQSVGQHLGYAFTSQPTQTPQQNSDYNFTQPAQAAQPVQTAQNPTVIQNSLNATSVPNSNAIPQSNVIHNQQSNSIAQSYVTQTLPLSQSITTPHVHSVHNIPEDTTLPMLNPGQKQSIFERKNFPQNII